MSKKRRPYGRRCVAIQTAFLMGSDWKGYELKMRDGAHNQDNFKTVAQTSWNRWRNPCFRPKWTKVWKNILKQEKRLLYLCYCFLIVCLKKTNKKRIKAWFLGDNSVILTCRQRKLSFSGPVLLSFNFCQEYFLSSCHVSSIIPNAEPFTMMQYNCSCQEVDSPVRR